MSKSKKFFLNLVIMFAIFILVGMLPPFGAITPNGMKTLGAFLAIVFGWIALDIMYTSIIGFFLLGLTGIMTPASAITAGFSNSIVQMTIIIGALAVGLSQVGVGELLTNFALSRKSVVGRPWLLVIAFAILGGAFGLLGNGMLGYLLLFSIVGEMARSRGYENKSAFMTFVFCMIMYCATYLPSGFAPWLPTMIMFGGIYTNAMPDISLPFVKIFVLGLILTVVLFIVLMILAKFVFRVDVSKFVLTEEERQEYAKYKAPMSAKIALACLGVYILFIVLPVFMGTENMFLKFLNDIGIIGWSIVLMCILAALRDAEGNVIVSLAKMFADAPWIVIMLLTVTIPLGNAMASADTGIMETMVMYVQPAMSSIGVIGMYIFVFVFLGVITQFAHNFVAGAIFLPLFGAVGLNIGADPVLLFFIMFTALNVSFATPAASMNSGILFAVEEVNQKWAYIWGWILLALTGITIALLYPIITMLL